MNQKTTQPKYSMDGNSTKKTIQEGMANTTKTPWKADFYTGKKVSK